MANGKPRRPGRPHDRSKDLAVLDAALTLLAAEGFDGMTMDQIASAAGISKVTIYSRWSNKSELVGAALHHLQVDDAPALTGHIRHDLVALLKSLREQYVAVGGMSILGSCLTDEPRTGELLRIIRDSTLLPRRRLFESAMSTAIEAGELRSDVDVASAVSALIGAFYADYFAGLEFTDERIHEIVDLVVDGIHA